MIRNSILMALATLLTIQSIAAFPTSILKREVVSTTVKTEESTDLPNLYPTQVL